MTEGVDVSIIIVTFNSTNDIEQALASVFKFSRGVAYEVIAIDNNSSDGTPSLIERQYPQVTVVRRAVNAGFAAGVNEGIARARGRAFFILNPDAELLDDALQPMMSFLAQHPDIGLLAPKLLDAEGTVQMSCRAFPGFAVAFFNRYSLLTRIFPANAASSRYLMTNFDHRTVTDVDWASGAAWLLPRRTVENVGLLDEAFFWSIEDVDYCQRVHRAGLRVVYYPSVRVRHRIGGSSRSAPTRAIVARHRGMWVYYTRYMRPSNVAARVVCDVLIAPGITLRCATQVVMNFWRRRDQSLSISTGT